MVSRGLQSLLAASMLLPYVAAAEVVHYGWEDPSAVTLYSETEASNVTCSPNCIEGSRCLDLVQPSNVYYSSFHHYLAWVSGIRSGDRVSIRLRNTRSNSGEAALLAIWTVGSSPMATGEVAAEVVDGGVTDDWDYKSVEITVPGGVSGVVIVLRTKSVVRHAGFHCFVDAMVVEFPDNAQLTIPSGVVPGDTTPFGSVKATYR